MPEISNSMIIFNGKEISEKILLDLKEKIKEEKAAPKLAVISVGEDLASRLFIKNKKRAARRIGIKIIQYKFKEKSKEREIIQKIKGLNADLSVNGIIVQLPLPKGFTTEKIISAIEPKKDVDGFHKVNRRLLKKGTPYFFPVLPSAILVGLRRAKKSLKDPEGPRPLSIRKLTHGIESGAYGVGKKIIALVNSDIFGQTLKTFLKREEIKTSYFLRKRFLSSKIKSKLKSADIIITVCGCPHLIQGNMLKKGVILIDGGIAVLSGGRVVGDVDKKSVGGKASFLTPVPGGIGPLTIALLLKNVFYATKRS